MIVTVTHLDLVVIYPACDDCAWPIECVHCAWPIEHVTIKIIVNHDHLVVTYWVCDYWNHGESRILGCYGSHTLLYNISINLNKKAIQIAQ